MPPLAAPPFAATAHCGPAKGDVKNKIAAEGARTVPPREHGGNCDIKDLSRGSKIYFPVYVKGGGLSMGDLHFSQGDGEITFCGAIEMAGWLHLKVDIIKGGMAKYGIKNPIFKPSPIVPTYNDYLIFEGISVDEQGKQYYLDVHIAYRQACLNAIEYLTKFGYSRAQAYAILGTAPCQGHISGVVDIPNACATLWLPTDIFDFDVMPSAAGPIKHVHGRGRDADVAGQVTKPHARERPMPVYDYLCGRCGAFTAMRPMAECELPNACPGCGRAAERAFLTAPYFSAMPAERRRAHATNERSAHAPSSLAQMKERTAPVAPAAAGSPCATASAAKNGAKSFPAARPWMISH